MKQKPRTVKLLIAIVAGLLLSACGTVTKKREFSKEDLDREQLYQEQAVIESELQQRRRLADQSFVLQRAAWQECGNLRGHATGIELIGIDAITSNLTNAARSMGIGDAPIVATVASGSPAANATILPGDELLAINGVKSWRNGGNAYRDAAKVLEAAEQAGHPIVLRLNRQGKAIELNLVPVASCRINLLIVRSHKPEPRANVASALIPYHMVKMAASPDELAALSSFAIATVIHRLGVPFTDEQARQYRTFNYTAFTIPEDDRLVISSITAFGKEVADADNYAATLMQRIGVDTSATPMFWRKLIARNMLSEKDNWGQLLRAPERLAKLQAMQSAK